MKEDEVTTNREVFLTYNDLYRNVGLYVLMMQFLIHVTEKIKFSYFNIDYHFVGWYILYTSAKSV